MEEQIRCLRCNSTQITANQKGFSAGKAVAGVVLTGGIGAVAGLHGKNKIVITCLACGNKWTPEEYAATKKRQTQSRITAAYNSREAIKTAFYKAYKKKDYETALNLYNKYNPINKSTDVSEIFRKEKKIDTQNSIIKLVIILFAVGLLYGLIRILF